MRKQIKTRAMSIILALALAGAALAGCGDTSSQENVQAPEAVDEVSSEV